MARVFWLLGAVNGALAVLAGAFGAHGLRGRLDESLYTIFQTGVFYHTTHALALVAVALAARLYPDSLWLRSSGWLFFAGIVLFSGSLYALALTGIRGFGVITPFGGIAFVGAWGLAAVAAWRAN